MSVLVSDALCGISDVQESLGNTSPASVNLITRKINEATRMIQNYTQQKFSNNSYVELYDGAFPGQLLVLRHNPVITFSKLEARVTNLSDGTFQTIASNLYFVDLASGVIRFLDTFWGGFGQWQATYTAGYAAVPSDVAEACATLASYLYLHPFGGTGVQEIREGSRQVNYQRMMGTAKTNLLEVLGIDLILDPYIDVTLTGDR